MPTSSSRRRSERHLYCAPKVQETMESLATVVVSSLSTTLAISTDSLLPLDQEINKQRNFKIAALEKILNKSYGKEMHWPLCGRRFFPPSGSLPSYVVKRLVRNAGMKPAPFMMYASKFEVSQPCVSHCWRKRTMECKTLVELNRQLTILESSINRPVSYHYFLHSNNYL